MNCPLQCAEQQPSPNIAPATNMTFKLHAPHTWNAHHNTRSNRSHPPTSPNMKSSMNLKPKLHELIRPMENRFEHDPRISRAWSDHDMDIRKPSVRQAFFSLILFAKHNISCSCDLPNFQQMLRLPRKMTLQHHQLMRLPQKRHSMLDPLKHGASSTMRAAIEVTLSHPPTSPNIAPATKTDVVTGTATATATLLYASLLYSTLLFTALPISSHYYAFLFSTLLFSSLLYSTLLFTTLLFSSVLSSTRISEV